MGRFTAVAGLDEMVALMVAPDVRKYADRVKDNAQKLAPQAKTWVTVGDGKVRPTHVHAGADAAWNRDIPENLRFKLPSMTWDMTDEESNHLGADTWMQHPRDWSSGAVANILDCRCVAIYDKAIIRNSIRTEATRIEGARVSITVSATGNRIVASEFGEPYDQPAPPAVGLRWMGRAAALAAG